MTKTYDLYGTIRLSDEQLRDQLSGLLGVEFAPRESFFKGDYFLAHEPRGERYEIRPNQIPGDDDGWDLAEEDFAEYPVLLYVSDTDRADELRERLRGVPDLVHLRRRER